MINFKLNIEVEESRCAVRKNCNVTARSEFFNRVRKPQKAPQKAIQKLQKKGKKGIVTVTYNVQQNIFKKIMLDLFD